MRNIILNFKQFANRASAEDILETCIDSTLSEFYVIDINKIISRWGRFVDFNRAHFDEQILLRLEVSFERYHLKWPLFLHQSHILCDNLQSHHNT